MIHFTADAFCVLVLDSSGAEQTAKWDKFLSNTRADPPGHHVGECFSPTWMGGAIECVAPPTPVIGDVPGPEWSQRTVTGLASLCTFSTRLWKSALCDITKVTEASNWDTETIWSQKDSNKCFSLGVFHPVNTKKRTLGSAQQAIVYFEL